MMLKSNNKISNNDVDNDIDDDKNIKKKTQQQYSGVRQKQRPKSMYSEDRKTDGEKKNQFV